MPEFDTLIQNGATGKLRAYVGNIVVTRMASGSLRLGTIGLEKVLYIFLEMIIVQLVRENGTL